MGGELLDLAKLDHRRYMGIALEEAEAALARGDRPIGAVVVLDGEVVARAGNSYSTNRSHLAHAELKTLLACAPLIFDRGPECVIYTTCEPCVLCLGAIVMANVRNVVFGMSDRYMRPAEMVERVTYVRERIHGYLGGVRAAECEDLYRRYSPSELELVRGATSRSKDR
jgi:tRNA(adenine34) deaminase